MSTITARLTAEQFAKQYMDVPLRELVRGEVIELMPGGYRPGRISGTAFFLLESWARQSGLGRAVTNETGLITERGPDTVRGADVAYFSFQRLPAGREPPGFSEVPPNLVVEVLGKGQGWNVMLDKVAEFSEWELIASGSLIPGPRRSISTAAVHSPPSFAALRSSVRKRSCPVFHAESRSSSKISNRAQP
ncbi:MAG TPA: Uma2 family endonuclease [Phycisphaerae bacterium]|jgi:Uma2 family endonuclease